MVSPVGNGLRGCGNPLLVARCCPQRADAGCHDQLALRFGQGADHRGFLRAGNHAVGSGGKRAGSAFQRDLVNVAVLDAVGVKIVAVKRGQYRDGKDFQPRSAFALLRGAHHLRVAMHGQEIKVVLRKAPHGSFDGGANVKQLHVQKDALAVFLFKLICKRQAAACQHAKANLVEACGVTDAGRKVQSLHYVGHIKGYDQAVIRHRGLHLRMMRLAVAGKWCQAMRKTQRGNAMILCFDIGGSRIKAALADQTGMTLLGDTPTPAADFGAFLAALASFVQGRTLQGLAISIAGVVDPETGRIKVANIPCADGRPLADEVGAFLGLPVLVLNDADCFALAEARQGAARGHRNVFGVILGTGVGGGLVIEGRLVTGAGGYAGEWGHGPVVAAPWAMPCGCGQVGCLDAIGGARGVERLHAQLHGVQVTSTELLAAWQAQDAQAAQTVSLWLDLMAPPLAMVVNTVGASILPVGGGLANVTPLVAALDQRVRSAILRQTVSALVVPAQCRPEPGLIGAGEAGKEAFQS